MPRWQLPDDILLVDSLPLTATGKIDKKALRLDHADHLTASAQVAGAGVMMLPEGRFS
jgi:fatty-acyl-CoA synthase